MEGILLTLLAYLVGSILFGEVIASRKGVNLREVGSGNVGATNVGRALGKKYAVLVFLLDMFKGFAPAYLAVSLFGQGSFYLFSTGIAGVVGHMFSFLSGFRGGKGVATAFGVVLAISFKVALLALLIWASVFYVKRYVSLASIVASLSTPLILLLGGFPLWTVLMGIVISALIVYRHRDNIERLLRGQELRV